jgi:hypothetical protein
MFKKRREKKYEVELHLLTQKQLLQQILLTLERMEIVLRSIDAQVGLYPQQLEEIADKIAEGIDRNTEKLSEIDLIPDSEPKES